MRRPMLFSTWLFWLLMGPALPVVGQTGACQRGTAYVYLDVAYMSAKITNSGILYRSGSDSQYGPRQTNAQAMYAAGLWIGGLVDGELRTLGTDAESSELWPGPIEDVEAPPTDCSQFDRVFSVYREDLAGEPVPDILEWPWHLGAPVEDGDGNPNNYDPLAGDRPKIEGDQSIWWVTNDIGNVHSWSNTQPLGIEVQTTAFAVRSQDIDVHSSTFYRYRLVNKNSVDIEQMYFGMWADPDLGDEGDDYVGSDPDLGLAFVWNADDFDGGASGWADRPPALGYTVVEGFLVNDDGIDNDQDGDIDEPDERIGMTNFVTYLDDNSVQGIAEEGQDVYGYLRSLWRDGSPVTRGGSGLGFSEERAPFMYDGPAGGFWSEADVDGQGNLNSPGNRRFVWSIGPFNLASGEAKEVVVALVFAQGRDRFESVDLLKEAVPIVRQAYASNFEGPVGLPLEAPHPISPADGADGQLTELDLVWSAVARARDYEVEILQENDRVSYATVESDREEEPGDAVRASFELEPGQIYQWRVRATNRSGEGPWSDLRTFSSSEQALVKPGPLTIDGKSPAFVQVQGIGDDDACGPNAGSIFGCAEVGGNFVYGSYNGQGDWIMYRSFNTGTEGVIGAFAPNDFEIRVTEAGSYGYYPFSSQNSIWVPFEVWDIGPTGPFGVNDSADDIRMIPNIFSDNGGECLFGFGELAEDPFGLGWPGTDRIYAYYPVDDYTDWESAVKPLVDEHPAGCPTSPATDDASNRIDFERGRPIQRIIFFMDPASNNFRDEMIPIGNVIRFYTVKEEVSSPAPSAPADHSTVTGESVLLWWNPVTDIVRSRLQVSKSPDFSDVIVDTLLEGDHYMLTGLESGTDYSWRLQQQSPWSVAWSFQVAPSTATTEGNGDLPESLEIEAVFPTPVTGSATVRVGIPNAERVSIEVFDLLGRKVAPGITQDRGPGWHDIRWSARDLASGVYFLRVRDTEMSRVKKVVVIQ